MFSKKNKKADVEARPKKDCIFCPPYINEKIIAEFGSVVAIKDIYPVTPGHYLILPRRHTSDLFEMTYQEQEDMMALIRLLRDQVIREDAKVTGFNIGMNCGTSAGQTIMHAHMHLIPRRDGDTDRPKGGVRGVIPAQQSYPEGEEKAAE